MRIKNSYGQYWHIASNNSYDIYRGIDNNDLLVANDNVETFDRGLHIKVPGKGRVLTNISAEFSALARRWGFNTAYVCSNVPKANHLNPCGGFDGTLSSNIVNSKRLKGRITLVKALEVFPMECIMYRHLIGPVWDAYKKKKRQDCDLQLPEDLNKGDKMPKSILVVFNEISNEIFIDDIDKMSEIIKCSHMTDRDSYATANAIREMCIGFYDRAYEFASERSVIIANAMFKLGVNNLGQICFDGGFMTLDSALFWDKADFYFGEYPKSFGSYILNKYVVEAKSHGDRRPYIPRPLLKAARKEYEQLNEMLFGSY